MHKNIHVVLIANTQVVQQFAQKKKKYFSSFRIVSANIQKPRHKSIVKSDLENIQKSFL